MTLYKLLTLIVLFSFLSCHISIAQKHNDFGDSTNQSKHNPRTATIYSAILPGLGQVYNKKYWKVPLIYGAGIGMVYSLNYYQIRYNIFKEAYFTGAQNKEYIKYNHKFDYNQLPLYMEHYRRNRDLSIFGIAVVYLLNVIDAMVDSYFTEFDISDNLTFNLNPVFIENNAISTSIALKFAVSF
jgi:hypothetical protein